MKLVHSAAELQELLDYERARGNKIGFVPTMGALHAGHLSLVDLAKQEADVVVVSIYVNPLQFGPQEDFEKYPRTLKEDAALLEQNNVAYLFAPSVEEVYPNGPEIIRRRQPAWSLRWHAHRGQPPNGNRSARRRGLR
jgi:pantoate--beta-alanine ligase